MLKGEVDIGIRTDNLPPTTQMAMLGFQVYQFLLVMLIIMFMN